MRSISRFRSRPVFIAAALIVAAGCSGPDGSSSVGHRAGSSQAIPARAAVLRTARSEVGRTHVWAIGDPWGLPSTADGQGPDVPVFAWSPATCVPEGTAQQCTGGSGPVSFLVRRSDTTTVPAPEYRNMILPQKWNDAHTYAFNYELIANTVYDVRFETLNNMPNDAPGVQSLMWQEHDNNQDVHLALGMINEGDGNGNQFFFNYGIPDGGDASHWHGTTAQGALDTWEVQFRNSQDASGWINMYRNGKLEVQYSGQVVGTTVYDLLSFGIYYYNWKDNTRSTLLSTSITFNYFDLSIIAGPMAPSPPGPGWHNLGGAASSIGAGPAFDPVVVGATPNGPGGNFALFTWAGSKGYGIFSKQLPGYGWKIAAAPDGTVWALTADHRINRANGLGYDVLPGSAREISVGANGTAYVVGDNATGPAGNYGLFKWNGSAWNQLPGYGAKASVSSDGTLWVVTADTQISRANGSGGYDVLPGTALAIAAAPNGMAYVIGTAPAGPSGNHAIFQYTGTTWVQVPGGYGVAIAVSPDGSTVYSLSADGSIRAYY